MMEVAERVILGVVTGGNPYAEKLLQTLDKSEKYSNILSKAKNPHTVLNAKNHEKEA